MRGDFQFSKDNYPFRLDSGIVRSKDAALNLVIDQRSQEVLLETLDVTEAATKHKELKDEYYAGAVGQAALAAQALQDKDDNGRRKFEAEKRGEFVPSASELAHGAVA